MPSTNSNVESLHEEPIGKYTYASDEVEECPSSPESGLEATGKPEEEAMNRPKNTVPRKIHVSMVHGHMESNLKADKELEQILLASETLCNLGNPIENSGEEKTPSPPCSNITKAFLWQGTLFRPIKNEGCQGCTSCGGLLELGNLPVAKRTRRSLSKLPIASPVPWERECLYGGTDTSTRSSSSSMTSMDGSSSRKSSNSVTGMKRGSIIEGDRLCLEVPSSVSRRTSPLSDGGPIYLPNGMVHYKGG